MARGGCAADYRLVGIVRVLAGATLTVAPGVVVRGDPATRGTLVVSRGGQLVADGTAEQPISFTSAAATPAPGDWGGVLLLGRAPTNSRAGGRIEGLPEAELYGGDDPDDTSGVLRFVRITYAGVSLAPNNETNGLTLGGVGSGTVVDHVLVANASDDCFEWFGGAVNASHLVCVNPGDDGFDMDLGFVGTVEDLVLVDHVGGDAERNGIEVDNDPTGSAAVPRTAPTVRRATLCGAGPRASRPGFALLLRRGAGGSYSDIGVDGFSAVLDVRDQVAVELRGLSRAEGVPVGPPEVTGAEEDDDHGLDEASIAQVELGPACGSPPIGGPGLAPGDRWDVGWVEW